MRLIKFVVWLGIVVGVSVVMMSCGGSSPGSEATAEAPETGVVEPTGPAPTQAPVQPVETAVPTSTPAPTAEPTQIPTAEPSLAPTATLPAPSPTVAFDPAVPPPTSLENAPWLLAATNRGLWAVDYSGEGASLLTPQVIGGVHDLQEAISPDGRYVAYQTVGDVQLHDLTLVVRALPSGENQLVQPLTSAETESGPDPEPGDDNFEIARALSEVDSIAWSPDGRQLAFMSAHGGSSSDLYVYTPETGEIVQLTDGPSQGIKPIWSPDGRNIVHAGVSTLGTGAGYGMQGVWAAAADGSGVEQLYVPDSGDEIWLGWGDNQTLIVYSFNALCGFRNMRTWQLESGRERVVWFSNLTHAAHDPVSNAILMSVPEGFADCNITDLQGLVFTHPQAQDSYVVFDEEARLIRWSAAGGVFLVETVDDHFLAITPDGDVETLEGPAQALPVYAPDGQLRVWAGGEGVWLEDAAGNLNQIFEQGASPPTWSPNGETLAFSGRVGEDGSGVYIALAPDFTPQLVLEDVRVSQLGWAAPAE